MNDMCLKNPQNVFSVKNSNMEPRCFKTSEPVVGVMCQAIGEMEDSFKTSTSLKFMCQAKGEWRMLYKY